MVGGSAAVPVGIGAAVAPAAFVADPQDPRAEADEDERPDDATPEPGAEPGVSDAPQQDEQREGPDGDPRARRVPRRRAIGLLGIGRVLRDDQPRRQVEQCAETADQREHDERETHDDRIDAEVLTDSTGHPSDQPVGSTAEELAWRGRRGVG